MNIKLISEKIHDSASISQVAIRPNPLVVTKKTRQEQVFQLLWQNQTNKSVKMPVARVLINQMFRYPKKRKQSE
jgi:hypothetical protein